MKYIHAYGRREGEFAAERKYFLSGICQKIEARLVFQNVFNYHFVLF
jgi:hypothetical protein